MIRIVGFFPTSPERVNFDLIFQPVQSHWRLFGIAINTSPAAAAAQTRSAPAADEAEEGELLRKEGGNGAHQTGHTDEEAQAES